MVDATLLPAPADFGPCLLAPDVSPPKIRQVCASGSAKLLQAIRQTCPNTPGIYAMLNRDGEILYIGKAKELRTRLMTYFRKRSRPRKAGRILRETYRLVWENWPHEFSAMLRELELIRRWRPSYNVQGQPLRRQQTYICLGGREAAYVFLKRNPAANSIGVYGPLPSNFHTREAVQMLNNWFQLRDCPQSQSMVFSDDVELFPVERTAGCLRHEIQNCLAPCAAFCSRNQYDASVQRVRAFLNGTTTEPLDTLQAQMNDAVAAQHYERAAILRKKWDAFAWLNAKLVQIRQTHKKMSFVYYISDNHGRRNWYFVHGGRTVRAIRQPQSDMEKECAATSLQSVYSQQTDANLLHSYEYVDGIALVSSWFLRYPDERKRTISFEKALQICGVDSPGTEM